MYRHPLPGAEEVYHSNAGRHLRLMHHGGETGGTRSQARPCRSRGAEKFRLWWLLKLVPALAAVGTGLERGHEEKGEKVRVHST